MHVRNATLSDLEAIIGLNEIVQQQHAEVLPTLFKAPMKPRQAREVFRGMLSDPNSITLLAEEAEPAGHPGHNARTGRQVGLVSDYDSCISSILPLLRISDDEA